ncbi:hypothetical protein PanWU01x14_330350 [Parasponia andersonii]|uniref:Uncharacterized protein n=1 Tax=Parasponia andersonii TaxID=3476 RepID=A0A2P5AI13_PARAD|nr:hypothetical protein PanWU01x14_330350 [Parasponia andersonii]
MTTTLTTPSLAVNTVELTKKKGKDRAIDEPVPKRKKTSALSGLTKNARKKKAKEATKKIVVKESHLLEAKIAQDDYKQKLDNAIEQIHKLEHIKGKAEEAEEKLKVADEDDVPQLVSTFELPRESDMEKGGEDKREGEHGTGILVIKTQPKIDEMIAELSGDQHF